MGCGQITNSLSRTPEIARTMVPVVAAENQSPLTSYNSSNFGWKIVYPHNWTLHETCCKGDYGFITLLDANSNVTLQFINRGLQNFQSDRSIEQQAQTLENNSANLDQFKLVSSKNVSIANRSALEIVYIYNPPECAAPPQITAAYCEYYQEPGSKLLYEMDVLNNSPVVIEYRSEDGDAFLQNLNTARQIINSSTIMS
jgi:hypothetical protein